MSGVKFAGPLIQQAPVTEKQVWLLEADGQLFIGNLAEPLDSSGYPTVMEPLSAFTKS